MHFAVSDLGLHCLLKPVLILRVTTVSIKGPAWPPITKIKCFSRCC